MFNSKELTYCCESINNNKTLVVRSSKGSTIANIREEHKNAYVQGDKVILTRTDGKTVIFDIDGKNRRQLS